MSRQIMPGDTVAGYYVKSLLGTGGMGAVFLAEQLNLGRDVALKILYPEGLEDEVTRSRFQREARVAAALRHPGVVEIYDFGIDEGTMFIAMECLTGAVLRSLVDFDRELIPVARSIDLATQIADVLVAAHDIGLVHRDLKPENAFVEARPDGGDRLVLVDFGLAFMNQRTDTRRMTREGLILGTPDYLSPEQAAAGEIGPETDIYSLGCVLYEMLSGRPPFDGTEVTLVTHHLFSAPPELLSRVPDRGIPQALARLVHSMLEKKPGDRPTAREVREQLAGAEVYLRTRERGRDESYLLGRRARMVNTVPPGAASSPRIVADGALVGVVGALPEGVALGLASQGLVAYIVNDDQGVDGAEAIFAPGATLETLAALREEGVPLLTDVEAGDVERLGALTMAVDEIVTRPVRSDNLAKKLKRALRKSRRSR